MSPPRGTQLPSLASELSVIALGGAIGACLRFGVSHAIDAAGLHGAMAAGSANLLGSFLLGLTIGRLDADGAHPLLRPFFTVGLFGSFTTFSALALDSRILASTGGQTFGLAFLAASIALGLGAFMLGNTLSADSREWARPESED